MVKINGLTGEIRVDVESADPTFCKLDEKEVEEAFLYQNRSDNLCDIKLGWKPESEESKFGRIGNLYDKPGKTWFRRYRPSETDKYTTQNEWRKIRRPWRHYLAFLLLWGPPGNLLYNMRVPMTFITIVVLANAIYGTMIETVNPNLPHWFALGAKNTSYSLTSFLVSLLLGFKVNRSFDRWWVARQTFTTVCARAGGLISSISLAKLEKENRSDAEKDDFFQAQRLLLALPFSIIMKLYSIGRCPMQIQHLLDKDELQWIESTEDAWHFLIYKVQLLLNGLPSRRSTEIDREINLLRIEINSLFTIKRSHFPYFLSKIPTALLMVYSFIVPMQLFGALMDYVSETEELQGATVRNILHYWYLAALILAYGSLILAANEGADLLEDPFYYIPMHHIAESEIEKSLRLVQVTDPENANEYLTLFKYSSDEEQPRQKDSVDDSLKQS